MYAIYRKVRDMFTFFNKSRQRSDKQHSGVSRLGIVVIAIVSLMFGATLAMSQANASTDSSRKADATSVSAKASFVGVTCQKTSVNGVWKRNGYGHVVVQSQGSSVDVVLRKNGKWYSTMRLPANSKDHFSYYSNTTSTEVTVQLRLTSTKALINEQMTLANCRP